MALLVKIAFITGEAFVLVGLIANILIEVYSIKSSKIARNPSSFVSSSFKLSFTF
jgi:hypothetical protein